MNKKKLMTFNIINKNKKEMYNNNINNINNNNNKKFNISK